MKEMVGGCCVCSDDRGWSENPLVYCDGQNCAVAVHQACYGIVSVPSGPWYCRKCESQERSARVRCELCPSRDGALKKTDNQGWAHVVCALYIPEVRFGNVTTMEPIILQLIPQERFNKTCYICQELGKGSRANAGACMQCNKSGCKQQFHVTCAQQLGLLCEEAGNYLDNVKYCGYCQHHYSKLKKGGNVKTIPPYKPVSHETNSSDGPSSPEKELEPATSSSSSAMKSRLPNEVPNVPSSSSSSSSKQRKSSSTSKGSSSQTSSSSLSSLSSSSNNVNNQSSTSSLTVNPASSSSQVAGPTTVSVSGGGGGVGGSSSAKTSSSSSSNKEKDKYSKNVNKTASTNKNHDKESSSSSSSSSSSQRDKSSKSSKTNKIDDNMSSSTPSAASVVPTGSNKSSNISDKSAPPSSTNTTRAASLSPAAIPTTLIIKQSHEKDVINSLNKEAKFTTSNFTETIIVNSDSVFGANANGSVTAQDGSKVANNPSLSTTNKKRKAGSDSRSTPTTNNMEIDLNNRDLIKDVAVSLVPLPHMNKNENIDTSTLTGIDKIKKAKTESSSPHHVPMEPNLQNVSPNVISQSSSIISSQSSAKPQTQVITQNIQNPLIKPAVLKDERQMSQGAQAGQKMECSVNTCISQQPTTPSLVVSVPLSTAQVPGVNLPSNSNTSSTSTIVSPNPIQSSSVNLFQHHISQRNQEQLMSASSSRSSPIVHQNVIHHQQNIMERQSPSISGGQLSTDHGISVLQSASPITLPVVQSASSSSPANDGGLKISYEKQTTNSRISSLQDEEAPGRRSRSQSGDSIGGSKNRSSKSKRSNQRSSPPGGSDVNLPLPLPTSNNSSSSSNNTNNSSSTSTNSSHTNNTSGSNINTSKIDHQPPLMITTNTIAAMPTMPPNATNTNNTSNISTNNSHPNKKIRLQNVPEIPSPSSSRTPDTHYTSNTATSSYQVVGSSGGLKFTYESQSSSAITTHPVMPTQQVVKESPPSSPGSDSGTTTTVRSMKRNRKSSTNSNAVDLKETKLFQNGVPTTASHAAHMLGNQLNPASSMSAKLSEHLNMEIEAHSVYAVPEVTVPLIGPQFPGKTQAARSMPTTTNVVNTGNPLTNMLSGAGTTNGNTPQSLEQLLERQWEQGSQFLMEQAQHFDIASLLSCLHQLRTENVRLEEHVNNLVARRDHLLAVNARLAIPLNPNVGSSVATSTSGTVAVSSGQPGPFNNMHVNGPTEPQNSSQTNRSGRLQQPNVQHFTGNQLPVENGLDFRHSSSNSSTIRRSSNSVNMNDRSNDRGGSGGGGVGTSGSYQQTIYNTAHQQSQRENAIRRGDEALNLNTHLKPNPS